MTPQPVKPEIVREAEENQAAPRARMGSAQAIDQPSHTLPSHRVLSMAEEELSRIVLDIHDGPVQYLFTALSLLTALQQEVSAGAANAESNTGRDADLAPRLARVATLLESSLYEIKFFLGTFRPPEFRRRTMVSMVEGLVIQHEEWTGNTVELTVDDVPAELPLAVKIAFYRILQEALSNAYRHAGVDRHGVRLWAEAGWLALEVTDQGRGFEPPDFTLPNDPSEEIHAAHIGLYGMRDRVELLGGRFTLTSKPGAGACIRAEVPIHG